MKILFFFCICIVASAQGPNWDQIRGKPPLMEWRFGNGIPTIPCQTAKIMYVDLTAPRLYFCAATDTWLPLVNGSAPTSGTPTFSTMSNIQFSGLSNAQFSGLPNS